MHNEYEKVQDIDCCTHFLKCFINDIRMLEVVVREEIKLVQEISNINAAEWVHLREGQNTRKSFND